jgi:hypothetical protein
LLESVSKAAGKAVKRTGSIRVTWGAERECSSIELNCIIKIRQCTLLLGFGIEAGSGIKAGCKVVERRGSIKMVEGTERECSSIELNGLIQVR